MIQSMHKKLLTGAALFRSLFAVLCLKKSSFPIYVQARREGRAFCPVWITRNELHNRDQSIFSKAFKFKQISYKDDETAGINHLAITEVLWYTK